MQIFFSGIKGGLGSSGSTNDLNDPPSSGGPDRPLLRLLRPPAHLALAHPRSPAGRRRPLHVSSQLGADDQPSGPRSRCRCVHMIFVIVVVVSQWWRIELIENGFSVICKYHRIIRLVNNISVCVTPRYINGQQYTHKHIAANPKKRSSIPCSFPSARRYSFIL